MDKTLLKKYDLGEDLKENDVRSCEIQPVILAHGDNSKSQFNYCFFMNDRNGIYIFM